jgi:uncharacterized membrane protein
MSMLFQAGRIFFGAAIAATGLQQFFFRSFFQIIFPPYHIPGILYFAYLTAAFLMISGVAIALNRRIQFFSIALSIIFLVFFVFFYLPYEFFFIPYSPWHLGLWTLPLKEFAYAGGSLVMAGSFLPSGDGWEKATAKFPINLVQAGRTMFAITMLSFGIDHFLYTETVENMVPGWIPNHVFWTYLAGGALISSGLAIMLGINLRLVCTLLAFMIFVWIIILHVPGALANPVSDNGNEVTSAFSALAFCGIALVTGWKPRSSVDSRRS